MKFGIIFLCFILLLTTGCETAMKKLKANPAPDSGFLQEPEKMTEQRERFPFNRVWVSPEFRQKRDEYTSIIVAPVNVSHLSKMDWWQRQNAMTQETLAKDAATVAAYIKKSFTEAIANDPKHRYTVVDKPGNDTLILELALVELVPSKAFFNAATTVGGFFVPGLGYAAAAGKGSVAIEGRIRDSQNGTLLGQMADREQGKSAVVDVAGMTWYESAKNNVDDWAKQFVELANTDYAHKVEDSLPFTLVTW